MRICKGKTKHSGSARQETLDTLFQGRLKVVQRKGGYRFSIDTLLLAHFVKVQGREKIVDLGAGNGVIPLMLAFLYPAVRVVGLEIQEEMVQRALRSVSLNRLRERVEILLGDVRSVKEVFPPQSFDVAICNPPYRGAASGRINPDPEKRVARHEIKGQLMDFLRAGSYLLPRGGRIALVYPATRMVDLLLAMRQAAIEPKRLRLVHSFEGAAATLVLAEGIKGAGSELKILPPLVVYTKERQYAPEIRAMLGV